MTPVPPLRRADWRFLLPPPPSGSYEHLILCGGPEGLAERLHDAGVARRVSRHLAGDRSADAVVVLDGAPITPVAAARCVQKGGVFYCEIDRRPPARWHWTAARVTRALEGAGLRVTGSYWTVPDFVHARRYLPLESAEVLAWYFATLQTTGSPTAFAADAAARMLVGNDWRRLAAWVPHFGVTAVARDNGGDAREVLPSVFTHPAVQATAGAPARVAMLTSGQDDGSRVVLLPFLPGQTEPAVVVKATRSPSFNEYTAREQLTLRELRGPLDADMRATIPEPLGAYPVGDLLVGLERYAPGPALVVSSGRWAARVARAIDDLRVVTDWLVRFHRQAPRAVGRWEAGLSRHVEARFEEYRRRLAPTAAESRLLALAVHRSAALAAAAVPSVWLHNDLGPWNIHRSGSRVTVIDWELGPNGRDRVGPPLCDLFYFLVTWYGRVRRQRTRAGEMRGFRELFLDTGEKNGDVVAARAAVQDYVVGLGIDTRFVPLLLAYTWADRALDWADRADRTGNERPAGNRYRDYVQLMAECADELFAAPAAVR